MFIELKEMLILFGKAFLIAFPIAILILYLLSFVPEGNNTNSGNTNDSDRMRKYEERRIQKQRYPDYYKIPNYY